MVRSERWERWESEESGRGEGGGVTALEIERGKEIGDRGRGKGEWSDCSLIFDSDNNMLPQ